MHPASDKNPTGKVELDFTVGDVHAFYRDMSAKGVLFTMPPKKQDFGGVLELAADGGSLAEMPNGNNVVRTAPSEA